MYMQTKPLNRITTAVSYLLVIICEMHHGMRVELISPAPHKFSRNLGAPEEWHAASSMQRTHKCSDTTIQNLIASAIWHAGCVCTPAVASCLVGDFKLYKSSAVKWLFKQCRFMINNKMPLRSWTSLDGFVCGWPCSGMLVQFFCFQL
jgi:hypothetical protein